MDLASTVVLVIEIIISVGSVTLATAHLVRVRRSASPNLTDLTPTLRRLPVASRAEELARRARPESWEHRLAQSLLETSSGDARVAAANDALADIDLTLRASALWPRMAVAICARGTVLLAIVTYLIQRSSDGILPVLGIGGFCGMACFAIGRIARTESRSRREAIDALVAALLGTRPL